MCRPLLLAAAVVAAVAALAFPEAAAQTCACPQPATQANFAADKYLGDWYEMKRVPRNFEDDGQCGMAHYSWVDATTKAQVHVLNTNYVPQSDSVGSFILTATPVDINNGKFAVSFAGSQRAPSKYWVLGTDYDTFAVVYSCTDPDAASTVTPPITLWVLARDPANYTAEVDRKAMGIITAAGLDPSILHTVDHTTGCPIASCRACSVTVNSLDLAKLKGRWWEVQHSPYSTGSAKQSCGMATFVATSDGVTLNGTTSESSATAGADKSMLLEAKWSDANTKAGEFKINNSEGKLCVVGTDYDTWAVVSICLPPSTVSTTTPAAGRPSPTPAVSGGVYVLARKRGLSAAKQTEANKAVTNAGIPAASMQTTPSTPCPAAALVDASGSAAGAAVTPAVLVLSVLTAIMGRLRPAQ